MILLDDKICKFREKLQTLKKQVSQSNLSKREIRKLYFPVRKKIMQRTTQSVNDWKELLAQYIADGNDVKPNQISPELVILERGKNSEMHRLYRSIKMTWNIPLSNGFGRRINGFFIDKSNDKVMGIFGLSDPVFNRWARDEYIGWNSNLRKRNLVNIMTTYILGAIPPYNYLLIGKFIAMAVACSEIVDEFSKRYFNTTGIISKEKKNAQLVALTNITGYGKSPMMERIKTPPWKYLNDTSSVGTSFMSDGIFDLAKEIVKSEAPEDFGKYKYGNGPNWKLRILKKAARISGFNEKIIEFGNPKGVYFAPIAKNWREVLMSETFVKAEYPEKMSFQDLWNGFRSKVVNRSKRKEAEAWKSFDPRTLIEWIESHF